MKRFLLIITAFIFTLTIVGCGNKNVEGSLEDLMAKVYSTLKEDETPMMLTNIEVTKENVEMYLGTSDIEFEEALVSESATGSIAHSVVLMRVSDNADVEKVKEKIKKSIDPRKWICVEAEEVEVESKGNLILIVMSSKSTTDKIVTEFNNL